MKSHTLFFLLIVVVFAAGCGKANDPSPVKISGNCGAWSYNGASFTGTASTWAGTIFESIADKPHTSGLQAMFLNTSPSDGAYVIKGMGSISKSNEVSINVVDASLPAITYTTPDVVDGGTVTVSHSGGSLTVKVTNLKLKGITAELKQDSIVVSGTIVK